MECDARSSLKKNPDMFDNHPILQLRMRAILLDWLNEVSYFRVLVMNCETLNGGHYKKKSVFHIGLLTGTCERSLQY